MRWSTTWTSGNGKLMSEVCATEFMWRSVFDNLDWDHNPHLGRLGRVLLRSYKYLPSQFKLCFLYCDLFPGGDRIKISNLIPLWIAEGIQDSGCSKTLEEVAHFNLMQLVDRSIIQVDDNKGVHAGLRGVKMHNLMHEVAMHIFKRESFGAVIGSHDTVSLQGQPRLAIYGCDAGRIPWINISEQERKTRSLLTFNLNTFSTSNLNVATFFSKALKALDLSGTKIEKLPSETLDIHGTEIKSLPETLEVLEAFPRTRHLLLKSAIFADKRNHDTSSLHRETKVEWNTETGEVAYLDKLLRQPPRN
ncbi:hypothetical protein IFM89_001856 [Coptis chinensis]|uniref:Disease resistance protein winged helix domain-containing protein n=1 Tax=Coptis chinensis TaxID=261450 RepID=A0A835HIH5_9MAGN|nr:hypothetical protein IFM89_001856 [Coptis chinensis]